MATAERSIRQLAAEHASVQVMVLVKATPQPSTKYGDTVCVAGALLEGTSARWIRLYPVPFRYLDSAVQFRKYETVGVELRVPSADLRPESAKINLQSIRGGPTATGWAARARVVEQLAGPTMCAMLDAVRADLDAPSLGAIRPDRVDRTLVFEDHGPWTPEQQKKMDDFASQEALFGGATATVLVPPKYKVSLRYWCQHERCAGHTQRIIDWELTALQSRYRRQPDDQLRDAVQANFMTRMFAPGKAPLIFVGNQENPQRRRSFTVLGVYYPDVKDTDPGLF